MNKVILMGRATREPEINRNGDMVVARYSLAVDRPTSKKDEREADFPTCVCFGKSAEFVEKYIHKGTKILVEGRIRTGSYTNNDGNKVYTTDVIVDRHEFAESKGSNSEPMIPEIDEELPFV